MAPEKEAEEKVKGIFMRVIVAGKRDFFDKEFIYKHLDKIFDTFGRPDIIIEGGASGVDTTARMYALEHHIPSRTFFAKWDTHGKAAGPIRNKEMAKYASKDTNAHLIAFWDGESKGTKNMIDTAKSHGIKTHIVTIPR